MDTKQPLSKRYMLLRSVREPFLRRAYECSRLTIPSLLSETGDASAEELADGFNSVGAEAVSSLANKLLLALFPPAQTFFRLRMTPDARRALSAAKETVANQDPETAEEQGGMLADLEASFEAKLSQVEMSILREFEGLNPRPELFQCLRHLIVGGTAALWSSDEEFLCVPLPSFVCERAGRRWRRVILRTFSPILDLPMQCQAAAKNAKDCVGDEGADGKRSPEIQPDEQEVALYTCQEYLGLGKYVVWQELPDGTIIKKPKQFREGEQPILVQTYSLLSREHYGRGLVEDFLGDFNAIDGLSKALVSMAAVMARTVGLVSPSSMTSAKEVNECPNGGFVTGRPEDIRFVQVEKSGDLAGSKAVLDEITMRVRTAFLSSFAVRRQGERVTAEEIRMIAQQLEETLGGVYSTLTSTLQQPIVRRIMANLSRNPDHKAVFKDTEPVVISGLEALGRQAEVQRIATFAQVMGSLVGPQGLAAMLHVSKLAKVVASSVGLTSTEILKTQKEMQAEAAAAQQQQQQSELILAATKGGSGPLIKAAAESQAPQPEVE